MSVFILPKSICYKLDASLRKFWWGENKKGNALMLKCWDSLCLPKAAGGLGFRRMFDHNRALISKLAWNLASSKKTIWTSLLKAKYLRNYSFLLAPLTHYSSSWIWKYILKTRDIGICMSIRKTHTTLERSLFYYYFKFEHSYFK